METKTKQRMIVLWTTVMLVLMGHSVKAVEEHVLILEGEEVRFVAVPEEGDVLKTGIRDQGSGMNGTSISVKFL